MKAIEPNEIWAVPDLLGKGGGVMEGEGNGAVALR